MTAADTISINEAQIRLLFEEAGLVESPVLNKQRVGKVLERAMHESVIKDTISFVFKGFPSVINGIMSVATGCVRDDSIDYRV